MEKAKSTIPQNQDQVTMLLQFIDSAIDEPAKIKIFSQLGHDCFYSRHIDGWVAGFQGDVQQFLDNVNVHHRSKYWESLELSEDGRRLILTGKEVDGCACSYAAGERPPQALCNHCCRCFQQELFGALFGKPVQVTITESYLLGNQRCSTVIDIL